MKTNQELLRRLGESKALRDLRNQRERLEAERERAFNQRMDDMEADRLRREIKEMGEKPCA